MTGPEAVVDSMYAAYFEGDADRALTFCASDAQWHAVTPGTPWTGSHPIRKYLLEILPEATAGMVGYAIETMDRDVIDELVVSRIRTTHGSGVMIFRVSGGKVSEIWVVNSKGRDTTGPF